MPQAIASSRVKPISSGAGRCRRSSRGRPTAGPLAQARPVEVEDRRVVGVGDELERPSRRRGRVSFVEIVGLIRPAADGQRQVRRARRRSGGRSPCGAGAGRRTGHAIASPAARRRGEVRRASTPPLMTAIGARGPVERGAEVGVGDDRDRPAPGTRPTARAGCSTPPWSVTQIGLRCCFATSRPISVHRVYAWWMWTRSASARASGRSHETTSSGFSGFPRRQHAEAHARGPGLAGGVAERDQSSTWYSPPALATTLGQVERVTLAAAEARCSSK